MGKSQECWTTKSRRLRSASPVRCRNQLSPSPSAVCVNQGGAPLKKATTIDKSVARGAGSVTGGGDGGGGPASSYSAPAPAPTSGGGGGGMMGELANAMARRKSSGPGRGGPPAVPYSAPAPTGGPGGRSPPPSMPAPMPGRGMGGMPMPGGGRGGAAAPGIPAKVCWWVLLSGGLLFRGEPDVGGREGGGSGDKVCVITDVVAVAAWTRVFVGTRSHT